MSKLGITTPLSKKPVLCKYKFKETGDSIYNYQN